MFNNILFAIIDALNNNEFQLQQRFLLSLHNNIRGESRKIITKFQYQ